MNIEERTLEDNDLKMNSHAAKACLQIVG